ncbi:MAG TPA: acyl carrier protein [Methylophilaceae bacterium]|nr:acyl carrier protein [Methylophilaceae bacterium]
MNTLERLQGLLISEYGLTRETIAPEATLADLGVDSLGMMELLFSIEKTFGIIIPNEQIELKTVGQVSAYIDKLVTEQGGTAKLAIN